MHLFDEQRTDEAVREAMAVGTGTTGVESVGRLGGGYLR
jgi:hypothetical protein